MSPFQPVGDRARWRVIYDELRKVPTSGTITYERLAEALDLNPDDDRHTIQMAVRRAAREHEESDDRALEAIPNVGYRIVEAPEHLRLARQQQRRSHRALVRGHSKVVHVDLTGVEPETRKAFEVVARAFSMQMDFNRRMDVRQRRLEDAISSISEQSERSAAEIAELRDRLARVESGNPTRPDVAH